MPQTLYEGSLWEILSLLGNEAHVSCHGSPQLQDSYTSDESSLRIVGGGRTAKEVLDDLATQAGARYVIDLDGDYVLFTTPAEAAAILRRRSDRLAATERILHSPVTFPSESLPGWRLPEVLRERTGLPVIVDESVWLRDPPLLLPSGVRPLRVALDFIKSQADVDWRLRDGTLYIVSPR